jgi:hypothetical protein
VYKVVALQPHCSSQLNHQLPSSPIAIHRSITMTAFLCKYKVALLEHMKSIPDAPATNDKDYTVWGRQFVDIAVSR